MKPYLNKLLVALLQGVGFGITLALAMYWVEKENSNRGGFEVLESLPIEQIQIFKKEYIEDLRDGLVVVSFKILNNTDKDISTIRIDIDLLDGAGAFVFSYNSESRRVIRSNEEDHVSIIVHLPPAINLENIDHAEVKTYSYWALKR